MQQILVFDPHFQEVSLLGTA